MIQSDTEEKATILVVDDDPNNVEILELDLEDAGFEVLSAEDGVKGWEVLQQHKDKIQAILLDRMMPNMDGMEFMQKLKADDSVSRIPVIMQTAAAERQQVLQGIDAGVYYYLTKPYENQVMLSIVRAAISDYADLSVLRQALEDYKAKLHIIKECHFAVATLEDVRYLATFLSNFFPAPERVVLGVSELLLNAVEHGNLGISYDEKSRLMIDNSWEYEIIRRQALPEHQDKRVEVHFKRDAELITLHIADEGKGFEWQKYLEIDPDRATHSHGRGIALSKMMSFDEIEYLGCGNEVKCTVYAKNS